MYYGELRKHNFEAGITGAAWPPDPEHFLNDFHPRSPQNYSRYDSKAFDDAMERGSLIAERGARYAAFHEAEAIAMKDIPAIPLYFNVNTNIVAPYLKGYRDNGRDLHPTRLLRIEK